MEKTALSQPQLLAKAARYCSVAEHCEAEVREKLRQWECATEWENSIIDYLYDNHYLNDERYCMAFVHDKVAYQAWGRQKIRAALSVRKLPGHLINKALNSIDEIEYNRQLDRLIKQKKGTEFEKLVRFLMQRGFTYSEITQQLS